MEKQIKPIPNYLRSNTIVEKYYKKYNHRTIRTLKQKQEFDNLTKRLVGRSSFVTVDRFAEMKNFRVSDFTLENLQAIGANLQQCTLTGSPQQVIDSISKL